MSDFTGVALMFAIGVFNLFFYWHANKWMHNLADAIVTGLVRGAPVSIKYRRFLLHTSWLFAVGGGIGAELLTSTYWFVIGGIVSPAELKLCAYLACFLNFIAVVGWAAIAPFWYRELAFVLRESEKL